MSLRKRIGLLLIALAVILLLLWSFRPESVAVSLAPVVRAPLQVTVEEEGISRVRDRYELSAPVAAYMARLPWEVGDAVQQGQVMVMLQPVPPQLLDRRERERAQAAVAEAEATYGLARSELNRIRPLFERGDVSESALNQAQAAAGQALANLRAARALLEYSLAEPDGSAPERVPLVSPVDGRVLAIAQKSAGTVAAGAPLLTVGNPERLEVAVDVLSAEAVKIRPGMPVLITGWGGDEVLEGRVRRVEPAGFTEISALGVEEQRVWVIVDIVSPREIWAGLGDGYRVEAAFVTWADDDVLQVPASALFRENGEWAAFVVEEGTANLRPVTVGRRAELAVQVLEGLSVGEQVITHPSTDVADGVPVVPRE